MNYIFDKEAFVQNLSENVALAIIEFGDFAHQNE